MGLCYQTEYRLGARGGRICRTYTGFRAFVAIAVDLALGLIFASVGLAIHLILLALLLCLRVAGRVAQYLVHLQTALYRAVRWLSNRVARWATRKPAWAGF